MAQPTNRQELVDYCLRQLGAPVLEVNVAEEQIDDLVDDAIQYFQERHFDGVEKVYLKYQITQDDIDRGKARPGDKNSTNVGLRAWWRPTGAETAIPSISVGFDTSETDASSNSNTTAYFVGLNWTDVINADDKIGLAFGQPQMVEGETIEPFLYELYYKYKVNDSISVTPTIFGGTSKNSSDVETDMTGYLLQTTFKF